MDASAEEPQHGPVAAVPGAGNAGGLADQLGNFSRELQQENDFEETLALIVAAALELIPGTVGASISVVELHGRIRSHAHSGDLAALVDFLQERTGEGPCLDAIWQQRTVEVPDFRHEQRWPAFAPAAVAAGAVSMLSFQLYVEADTLGALNLYGAAPHAFDAESREIGVLVASHAAVAFADARRISNLEDALATRDVIGQAKGILMERYKVTDQQAFLTLVTASSRTHEKLRRVAEQLVVTGDLPGAGPGSTPAPDAPGTGT
ncbi:ANTAR domain-containing protein [Kocuria kalidii]|uniref:GAF and ANTAR domain-containing protein n=1 Tax=Kocuria kalidii TaxID=3376283 RepID=UPI0037A631EA